MRTTVSIADELLRAAKRHARQRGRSLGAVIEDALRRELAAGDRTESRPEVPVFAHGTGPRPGVDLASNQALHEVLDEGQALERLR